MIVFKSVTWQNVLSTGNEPTKILLNKSKSTLITGKNGSGKSTFLDAICFALYGRAYRAINKPLLVNSITNKNMYVEVEFSIGKKEYVVKRGMKPGIFEIYVDGILIPQNASVADYQTVLETQILKLNFKAFTQIIVIGSANFIPFMQLNPGHRREVIEDLLDIKVFSRMNFLLRDMLNNNKQQITETEFKIKLLAQNMETHRKLMIESQTSKDKFILEYRKQQDDLSESNNHFTDVIIKESENLAELTSVLTKQDTVNTDYDSCIKLKDRLSREYTRLSREIDFYSDNDICPSCSQEISADHKHKCVTTNKTAVEKVSGNLDLVNSQLDKLAKKKELHRKVNNRIREIETVIMNAKNTIKSNNKQIEALQISINTASDTKGISDEEMTKIIDELNDMKSMKENLVTHRSVLENASLLLKDSGIKSKIIAQYIPIINKHINKYLHEMDFYIEFNINGRFEETIKSRFKDEFGYMSFSEGEKQRIDMAMIFVWRAIAKMRNSASTNLLILDECFDSSLDDAGTEDLLKLLDSLPSDCNTFVISHKGGSLHDKFHSHIEFEKVKNFSRIKRNTLAA